MAEVTENKTSSESTQKPLAKISPTTALSEIDSGNKEVEQYSRVWCFKS